MSSIYSAAYRKFIAKLREARQQAGLTQIQAAKRLGRTQNYMTKCETRQRRIDVLELAAFAKLYRKPLNFFIDDYR